MVIIPVIKDLWWLSMEWVHILLVINKKINPQIYFIFITFWRVGTKIIRRNVIGSIFRLLHIMIHWKFIHRLVTVILYLGSLTLDNSWQYALVLLLSPKGLLETLKIAKPAVDGAPVRVNLHFAVPN